MSYNLTIVESPYAGDIEANLEYARAACLDCIQHDENPFASHLLYPQFLNDEDEGERYWGINCGFAWGIAAQFASKAAINPAQIRVAFYIDKGWSPGMEDALERYTKHGFHCVIRRLEEPTPSTANNP